LEPAPEQAADAHRVTLESGRKPIAAVVLGAGLGDAVIARFAILAGLDLLRDAPQTGRATVRHGERLVELIVTLRPTDAGLRAELRLIDDDVNAPAQVAGAAAALPDRLPAGFSVGPYRIAGVLGSGGMGVVYRAEHTLLGRDVAIKVLRRSLLEQDPHSVQRFLGEARMTARVRYPGIVAVSDVATLADGRPYLVMELLSGHSLADAVADALDPVRAVQIARRIAAALQAAHDAGVVHRDLSPGNVFLLDRDAIKLVDFGAARRYDGNEDVPDGPPGVVFGTPWYMAPEQALGKPCDARTDLYSLGVVLYEMLAGAVPFDGETPRDVAVAHVSKPAPRVASPIDALPQQLESLVARLLRKNPDERHQTAAEVIDDLRRIESILQRPGWRRWLPR
jgi:serine/threonine-protein kinase